jgi:hypothetical protein
MRILHVISGLRATAGGTVAALIGLARAQRREGADASIVSTYVNPEKDAVEAVRHKGIPVHEIGPCRDPMSRSPLIRPELARI